MTAEATPVVGKSVVPTETWRDSCKGWTLVNGPHLHVIQEWMPPGTFEIRHSHQRTRQLYYVLDGEATVRMTDGPLKVTAGEGIEIPPGVPHQMRNDSSAVDLEFLVISSGPPREDRQDLDEESLD